MNASRLALLALFCLPVPAAAQNLVFAGPATVTGTEAQPSGTLPIATGGWMASTGTPIRSVAGDVRKTAYRIAGATLSTLNLLELLRQGLLDDGFVVLFECETQVCGGFDFRYDLPLIAEPAMHVDLGDFRYLSATRITTTGAEEAVSIVVSRSRNAGFVQVNFVGDPDGEATPILSTASEPAPIVTVPSPVAPVSAPIGDFASRLESGGAFALDDLVFASGAAELAPGSYASLQSLASYLAANPERQIAIVGHTDASGSLEANIALSRRRAEAVRRAMIETLDVKAAQVQAEGVGFLAPRASNLTDEGRAANRRVEVMLRSTE